MADSQVSRFFRGALGLGLLTQRLGNTPPRETAGRRPWHPGGQSPASPRTEEQSPDQKSTFQWIKTAVSRFLDDDCTTMAAALAYYTTFSIAPLLLIVISIVGLVFGRQAVQEQIQTQIQGLIGSGAASQVGAMVQSAGLHQSSGVLSAVLGVLALIAGATGAFTQLQSSLNRVWSVKPDPKAGGVRNFLGHRILSLGMILAIAFLLLVSLALSAALAAFGNLLSGYLPSGFSGSLLMALEFL